MKGLNMAANNIYNKMSTTINNILKKVKAKNGYVYKNLLKNLSKDEFEYIENIISNWNNPYYEYTVLDALRLFNKGFDDIPMCELEGCNNHIMIGKTKTFHPMKGCCKDHTKKINSINSAQTQKELSSNKKKELSKQDIEFLENKAKENNYEITEYPKLYLYENILVKCKNCETNFYRKHYYWYKKPFCQKCLEKDSKEKQKFPREIYDNIANSIGVKIENNGEISSSDTLYVTCKCGIRFSCKAQSFRNGGQFCSVCTNNGRSQGEDEVLKFVINQINPLYYSCNRKDLLINDKREIDMLFTNNYNKFIGIEFNGLYRHGEISGKDRNYHISKTLEAKENGIELLHITDNQWKMKRDIVKSILMHKMNMIKNNINGRDCYIDIPNKDEEQKFLNENHIQGYRNSKIAYGLYEKNTNKLVSILTFSNIKDNKWEIIRFCNKNYHNVRGSFSKLLKEFEKNNIPQEVYTFSEIDLFPFGDENSVYLINGFELVGQTNPNYFYYKNNTRNVEFYSRHKFQKHKLAKQLEYFDETLSEWENMKMNGYDRYWNCGNWKFVKRYR